MGPLRFIVDLVLQLATFAATPLLVLTAFVAPRGWRGWDSVLFLGVVLACTGAAVVEVFRDAHRAARTVFVPALVAALLSAVGWMGSDGTNTVTAWIAAGTFAIAAAAQSFLWSTENGFEDLPNPVRFQFGDRAREIGGVQFGAPVEFFDRGEARLCLLAQNCYDEPREVTLRFGEGRRWPLAARLFLPAPARFLLLPGAHATVVVPLARRPGAEEWTLLLVVPGVRGTGGRRVRRWRARPLPNDVPLRFATLLTWVVPFRRFTLEVPALVGGPPGDPEHRREVRVDLAHRPEPAIVRAAARRFG